MKHILPLPDCLDPTIERPWTEDETGTRFQVLTGKDMEILQKEIKRLSFSVPFDWGYEA